MSKFWTIVTVLFLIGIVVNLTAEDEQTINFTDLETECRYDRTADSKVNLNNRKLQFSGQFPVENPSTQLSHTYQESEGRITLNIEASNQFILQDFFDNCRALAIYDGSTDRIEPGTYLVTVNHDGREAHKSVIEIR